MITRLAFVRERDTHDTIWNAEPCRFLLQFQHVEGQLVNLLRVAVEDSLDVGIRQVAAISFKNLVRKDWEPQGAAGHLSLSLHHDTRLSVIHAATLWTCIIASSCTALLVAHCMRPFADTLHRVRT